ncbi:MAG: carboxypeptidase-like regulatory domain-containing protein [Ignavibacteriales bacterium]|nr:carboxypeptidase-like regulatory domain-containing protein [Ignavibacteriales bacterium]
MIKKLHSIFVYIIIIVTVTSSTGLSQSTDLGTISGKIFDSVTKETLPGVSVYLSGTTIGISSDKNGNYKIGKIPAGKYIIVVSMIGYKPLVQNLEISGSSNILKNFFLENKPIEMNAIVVQDQSDVYDDLLREQKNYRDIFKKYFLGQTELSNECQIENIEEIIFSKKFEPNIQAECPNPIIVINKALGYRIECVLLTFIFNTNQEGVNCEFYPKFTELIPKDENQNLKWKENRKSAFNSSLRRFMLSRLQSNVLLNNYGYAVTGATKLPKGISLSSLVDSNDKIVFIDTLSGLHFLKFKGFLFVNNFLTDEQSFVYLPFGTAYIGKDGYPIDPRSLQVSGVFAKHGLANMLPIDNSYIERVE